MIIQYKFQVRGILSFQDDLSFRYKGRTYLFETKDQKLSYLVVRVNGDVKEEAPQISIVEEDGTHIQHVIIKRGNLYPFIQAEVRNLEGILGPFGVEEIDIYRPEISWIGENEDERKLIHIRNYKIDKNEIIPPPLPPDLMMRSIVAAYAAQHDIEIPLIFYRKAFSSFRQERYLEACYDYFFFLECLYGDSAVKKAAVQNNFKNASVLQSSIKAAMKDPVCIKQLAKISRKHLAEIQAKDPGGITDYLVEFRGEIHHYKARYKETWQPGRLGEAEFEATLFKFITGEIALNMVLDTLYNMEVPMSEVQCFRREKS